MGVEKVVEKVEKVGVRSKVQRKKEQKKEPVPRLTVREGAMLLALWNLRYLTGEQIHRGWYSERSFHACRCRLTRLAKGQLLERIALHDYSAPSAWRLGSKAFKRVDELYAGDFFPYREVSVGFIPHLVETNSVFLNLAAGEWLWDRLPFTWTGSHRGALPFRGPPPGKKYGLGQVDRVVHPDAIVAPKAGVDGHRTLIELDRATEAVVSRTGRTSIRRKLEAYQQLFCGISPSGRGYLADCFGDSRRTVVLFVVRASGGAKRRQRSILREAKEICGFGEPSVDCVIADQADVIRRACGFDRPAAQRAISPQAPGSIAQASPAGATVDLADVRALVALYTAVIETYRCLPRTEPLRAKAKKTARAAQVVVARLSHEFKKRSAP